MTSRRKWTVQEEAELKALIEKNASLEEISVNLKKSPKAVITKSQRLGLPLQSKGYIDTSIHLPRQLPSIEETTKILAGALKASIKPGLSKLEIQRLQVAANIAKMYKELVVDYAHYRDVERKLVEMGEQNAKLQKTLDEIQARSSSVPSQPVSN